MPGSKPDTTRQNVAGEPDIAQTTLAGAEARCATLEAELATTRQALHESRSRYRLIIDSLVGYAIIATDLAGRITLWTESAAKLFGWPEQRMLGVSIEEIFTEADILAKTPQRAMRSALASNVTRQERWHRRSDGMHFFASGEVVLLRDDSEALAGFLHILRDRTEERKVQHELEASRERLEYALSSSAVVGTWDWDVVNDLVYADEKFHTFFGLPPRLNGEPLPISRFREGVHPDDRDLIDARLRQALKDGVMLTQEFRTIDHDGNIFWVSAQGRCFKDAAGNPIRFPGALIDISREKRREARQAAILKLVDDLESLGETVDYTFRSLQVLGETLELRQAGYVVISEDESSYAVLHQWNDGLARPLASLCAVGPTERDLLARLRRDGVLVVEDVHVHPATREHIDNWRALKVGSLVNMAVVDQGQVRMVLFLHSPVPRIWEEDELAFVRDILNRSWAYSRRRQAEQALIEAETRLRLAQEAAEIGTFEYRITDRSLDLDTRSKAIFGIGQCGPITVEGHVLACIVEDDRARVSHFMEEAFAGGLETALQLEFRILSLIDGTLRHVRIDAQTVIEDGRPKRLVGAVRDVTDQRTADERQAQLTRELRHRVKNTLAMVNALANLTLRRAATPQEGLAVFSARLTALSQAHEILTQTSWTSAPIRGVVARSLERHPASLEGRITTAGPDIHLSARQSLALSLALHELLSNAERYGALSTGHGQVRVEWSLAMPDDRPHLHLTWRESGGPVTAPPTRFGLGLKLIRQSLPIEIGGTVDLAFMPEGVLCTVDAPIHIEEEAGA